MLRTGSCRLDVVVCNSKQGSTVHSAILDWAGRENIDLLVLGTRENRNAMQKIVPGTNNIGSTSDIIKSRCKCPCLIVRPAVGPPLLIR